MTRIWFRDPAVGPEPGAGGAPQAGEPEGLRGDPPLSLASAALESKHHPTPFRPAVPQGLQSPCVTDHSCVPVTADGAHCQGALLLGQPLSGHGATGTLLVLLISQRLIRRTVLWRV